MPFPAAILMALMVGLAVGLLMNCVVAKFSLQPLIVTLATMGSLRGLLYVYSATPKYPLDPLLQKSPWRWLYQAVAGAVSASPRGAGRLVLSKSHDVRPSSLRDRPLIKKPCGLLVWT